MARARKASSVAAKKSIVVQDETKPVTKAARKTARVAKTTEVEKPVRRGRKVVEAETDAPEFFNPYVEINKSIDEIEKKTQVLSGIEEGAPPMSTNLLTFDLMLDGGIRPSWYTMAGGEQSAKTTMTLNMMAASIKANIPVRSYWDYEGSTSASMDYIHEILKQAGINHTVQEVFTGTDGRPPIVRYQPETRLETFFDYLKQLLTALPKKRYLGGKWWYIYPNTKPNQSKYGSHAVSSMMKKYGSGIYIPAPNGDLQAIIFVDSYPAMNPDSNDDDEADNSLAVQARAFSKHLPRVKGALASRRVAVIGVNQIRAIPMARYGPTEQEPGGQALRFYSDVRVKHTSRALSGVPIGKPTGEGQEEHEKSLDGGTDTYRYIALKTIKNKLSSSRGEYWIRLWVKDSKGIARGIDPVFDTIYYLSQTGQLQISGGKRNQMKLTLEGMGPASKAVAWMDIKKWVLGAKADMKEMSAKYGFKRAFSLRALCFDQIKKGKAGELYAKAKGSKNKDDDYEDDDE